MANSEYQAKLIKVIHVAKRELGMQDDDYRAMLASIPALEGATSTAGLPVPKLQAVLDTMKGMGFKVRPNNKSKGKPHNFNKMPGEITKIEALLTDMSLPWKYADAIANQMFGIKRVAWVKDRKKLASIIAALYVEQKKRRHLGTIEEFKKRLGPGKWTQLESRFPERWERSIDTMEMIIDYLTRQELQESES
ncbi:gp16 family protein [Neptuniibacter sp.]|uniref:gp16 family protein n=1 Tax=Neptuniibacter sp. TaxID=1962643 RepID=UPI003B5A01DE